MSSLSHVEQRFDGLKTRAWAHRFEQCHDVPPSEGRGCLATGVPPLGRTFRRNGTFSVVLNDSDVILPLTDLADVPVVGVLGIGCLARHKPSLRMSSPSLVRP